MTRSVLLIGAVFVTVALALVLVKVFVYELPLVPADTRGMWQVETRITLRGHDRAGSVTAMLPPSDASQVIFDEHATTSGLEFSVRDRNTGRFGVWQGPIADVEEIAYEFRVQTLAARVQLPGGEYREPPSRVVETFGGPEELGAASPEVATVLSQLSLPGPTEVPARLRTILAFVANEIAVSPTAGDDALLTLAQREGNAEGKERLLVALLRAAGIPARSVRGLALREDLPPEEVLWGEAWVNGVVVPVSAVHNFIGDRPADWIGFGSGGSTLIAATGVRAVGHSHRALREQLRPEEIAALMAPANPILAKLSLYRLPVPTQSALRVLLLLPIGALAVAIFRNLIGIPTFGTFMPVLIALALRSTSLIQGLLLVALVMAVGVVGRLALDRLRLLMVPRLAILLCLVVLAATGLALAGDSVDSRDLFSAVLFPIVILTMLVERFTIAIAEEGTARRTGHPGGLFWSILVAVVDATRCFRSPASPSIWMFTFPELLLASITGVLVWIGGYARATGWPTSCASARWPRPWRMARPELRGGGP